MPSYYDPSLYNIRHENNQIVLQALKLEVIYNTNPKAPTTRQPRVNLNFILRHQLVPGNTARISPTAGFRFDRLLRSFNQPLRALTSDPGPAVAAMFSRLDAPFELMGPESSGRLLWAHDVERAYVLLEGLDDVAEMIRSSVERMVGEAGGPTAVKSLKMGVSIWKRTVLDTKLYDSLYDDQEVNDGVNDDVDREVNDDGGFAAEEFLETVAYGDVESNCLVCAICTDDFLSGTHVARLPCSHMFHGDCVVPWLQRKRTCPLCRFRLVKN